MNRSKNQVTETHICRTVKDMIELGKAFAERLKNGDVVSLRGSLGSGKTVFVKGVALALNIKENITSPTFTLVQQYNGNMQMNHLDLYRLTSVEDFYNIGGNDFLYPEGISLIEWTEVIDSILPENTYRITISLRQDLSREVNISVRTGQ